MAVPASPRLRDFERRADCGMATAKQAQVTSPVSCLRHSRALEVSCSSYFSQVTCELKAAALAAHAAKAEAAVCAARETVARELAEARETRATTTRRDRIASIRNLES